MRLRPFSLAFFVVLFCLAVLGLLNWRRNSRDFSDAALLKRLPDTDGTCIYLNVQALRVSGMLDVIAGRRAEEAAEYQNFVKTTAFDYRDDLDTVMAYFGVDFNLFILRGRFSWEQISRYMRANNGKCTNGVCVISLDHGRFLSALPLSASVIALGTGTFKTVVYSALEQHDRKTPDLPKDPFWVELSEYFLRNPARLPEGTRAFMTALSGARHAFLSVAPIGGAALEAHLQATFDSPSEATARRMGLERNTELLRKFFERDKQKPEESELGSMLLAGKFVATGTNLEGTWPLPVSLFRNILEDR